MRTVILQGAACTSQIDIGASISDLSHYTGDKKTLVITDENVRRIYHKYFNQFECITLGTGESIKTLDTADSIYAQLLAHEIDRSCLIVGIGGGIVTDITGFVASTFMRGVEFGYVASTLLGQVDAAVGGKTGVNLEGYKNIVGTFAQPRFVLCDPAMLSTLPPREIANGFSEVIKYACIKDAGLFSFLEEHVDACTSLERETIAHVVATCVSIKTAIVEADERETGARKKLNFGHTFGHALEKKMGLSHGEAVSLGMVLAAKLSAARKRITGGDVSRLTALLTRFHLPTEIEGPVEEVIEIIKKDKKRQGGVVQFVLLDGIGEARVTPLVFDELEAAANDMRQHR